ncbi:MAG: hypothetical protein E3J35_01440 [Methanomassiliicoccales archaeon]|nr:MAG: hypothetical protein E3J35_01440 [Methanomassiliicoccales archaeon]
MPKNVADRTFKKGIAVAICVTMALSGSLILWNGNVDENVDTAPAIVYLRSPSDAQLLRDRGVDVVESYRGFVLANLAERQIRLLESQGFSVEAEKDLRTIALNGFTIDTRVGTPSLPADLYIEAYPNGIAGRYIVQFIGPVKEEWTRTLTNLGGEVGNYLPNNAFMVRMNGETMDIVSSLRFVQWVDVFQPAYKIRPELWDRDDTFDVKIITYEGRGANSVLARLTEDQTISAYIGDDFGLVRATIDKSFLPTLANIPGVSYIEPLHEIRATNMWMQWVVQTNVTDDRKMWDLGLNGTGQLIALADTGVDFDHPAFRENETDIVKDGGDIYNVTDMTRRKVVRYIPMASYVGIDPWTDKWAFQDSAREPLARTMGHGTMMAGIGVGNDNYNDTSPNDGSAIGAKLIVQDVANVCEREGRLHDCFSFIPDDYDDFFGPAYDEGARIHTNSWGTPEETYDLEAMMVDKFVYEHPDLFITWSAGNGGPFSPDPHLVGSPANAKDVVAVGWVGSPSPMVSINQNNVHSESSTGPTPDGRMKPDLVNLGAGVSTTSDGNPRTGQGRADQMISGTSYGAPTTAGMAAMIRQYYEEGYYPTGTAHPASVTNTSAALVKALLMASGERCTEGLRDSVGEQRWPNNSQGWGRPLLDNVLYFPGDTRKTISIDQTAGLITGDVVEYNFKVMSNSVPLRVMLVWSDYPGTLGASTILVNDLDLAVTDPDGNTYKGNVFSIPFTTSQSRTGGLFDHENPTEGVHLWHPKAGVYNVQITAYNVPKGPQPFALVINADIDTGFGQIQIDRAIYSENDVINIEVVDTNLIDDGVNNKVYVTSTTEVIPETVNLTEIGSGIWKASIPTAFGAPYENNTLEVTDKDIITVWYDDPDPPHTATALAVVDAAGPIITDVFVRDITNAAATVTWVTDEPSDSRVFWGDTPALGTETYDPVLSTYHEVDLLSLSTGVMYYFDVQSTDWLGHTTLDDNGGSHYTFTTTIKAEILLVIGDGTFPEGKIPYWRNAIMYGGWSFNEWYVARTGDPPLSMLQQYKVVAWQTGFEQYPAFEDSQTVLLTNYLDGGGRLFVVSHDVAWASHPSSGSQFSTPSRYAFLKDSLKSEWLDDPLDWSGIEGVMGDPIGGAYAPPNRIIYEEFRNGGAGDEVAALAAGGTTDYVFKSYDGVSNNDHCAIRWVSSLANDSVGGDDPNITWDGYPSKVVVFFFELVQMNYFAPNDVERGDVVNKTIIWLLDGSYHPIAEVSHPNGGEVFTGGALDIYWNITAPVGVANQSLFYSDDSGQTWLPIDLTVSNVSRSYAWDISGLPNGDDYMVKIIVEDSSTPSLNGTDASDGTFSIFRPGGDTVGPVTVPGSVRVTPNPVIETGNVTFDAIISDELKGDSNIGEAEFFVQPTQPVGVNGTGTNMSAVDGTYDSKLENVTWSSTPTPVNTFGWGTVGTHTVWVHGLDDPDGVPSSGDENWGTFYSATFEIIPTPPDRVVLPPSGLTADLSGVAFADVTLTWTLSGDDGAGEDDVVRYDIYRGTIYDANGMGYVFIGNSTAGVNTYVDTAAGNGDPSNYFYFVSAVDDNDNDKAGVGQAAKFTRYLTAGVNLVSNPLIVNDYNVLTVLQTINFDTVWVYEPSVDPSRPWITYDVSKPYYAPDITDNFRGAWVNVLTDGYFTIAGVVPTPSMTIPLRVGWNLVAYPSFDTTYTLWDLLNDTNADRVETYDLAGAPYNLRHMTDPFETLVPGSGYWIQVSAPVDWVVWQA